jgi:hypothetical protein
MRDPVDGVVDQVHERGRERGEVALHFEHPEWIGDVQIDFVPAKLVSEEFGHVTRDVGAGDDALGSLVCERPRLRVANSDK